MGAFQRWSRYLAVPLALLAFVVVPASARAPRAAIGLELRQCANGTSGIGDCIYEGSHLAWHKGDLGQGNSLYREGDFVPFRMEITGLVSGETYTLGIGYDAVEKSLHTYDYLGTYNASEKWPGPPAQQVLPCGGIADTEGPQACGHAPSTFPVPKDPHTTFPSGSGQADGHFSAWGAALEGARYNPDLSTPIGVGTLPAKVERGINLTLTAEGSTAVVAWGGHLASVLDWGQGKTFTSGGASGASFHMRLTTGGGEELSINSNAIAEQPPPQGFTTEVAPQSVAVGQPVIDTATLTGRPGTPVRGDVQFFVCGPSSSPPACGQGGTAIQPPPVVLARVHLSPDGVAEIEFIPTATGHYCFRAEYAPSADAPYSPAVHTNRTTECFVVTLPPPRLEVTKVCDPTTDPGHFTMLDDGVPVPNGTNTPCGGSTGEFETTVGTHTVGESAGTGTNLGNYTSTIDGDCAPNGSITLALGDVAICTITNVRNGAPASATLTVHKVCNPASDPGQFEIHVDDLAVATLKCGASTEPVELAPGSYTVREEGVPPTSLSDYTTVISGACAANGSIMLVSGQSAECTFTNTRIPPRPATLRIDKVCDPAGDNGRFNLRIDTLDGDRVHEHVVGCGGTTGAVHEAPGSYTVGETGAGGTHLAHYQVVIGGDCDSAGTVAVEAGEQETCTITNVRRGTPFAELTVTKICVPADDGGRFKVTIAGQRSREVACGGTLGPVVSPGPHHVSESAGTGTSLSDYTTSIGGSCAPDGTVTLTAGESATCTITNVRKDIGPPSTETGTVEIQKRCSPAGTVRRFELELDDALIPIACGESTGPIETGLGDHEVGEVAESGNMDRFETTVGGDCSASGSFTLSAGQHVTCVVTNTRVPPKPVPKPPAACYRLAVSRRMVTVGQRVRLLARVHLHGRPIQGVRVYAAGPGVFDFRTTGPKGKALFVLSLRRAGILKLTIRRPFDCPKPPPRKIGVLGVRQPSLTG